MTASAEEMQTVSVEDFSYFTAQELARALPMFRLTASQYDVWNTLLGEMGRGGRVVMTQDEIADRLGTNKANISPALTVLRERGLCWRESPGVYRINPRIAFKGTVDEWNEAMDDVPADVPEVVLPKYRRRPPRPGRTGRAGARPGSPTLRGV
ncbi:replication/maintenance protein RepL [Streptomyces longwoodensis]|uniref:replication/maintenance protein RepL n=1 Tax=Streptomyces longwoodensis TaxID=68231 RepID=UPI0036FF5B4A